MRVNNEFIQRFNSSYQYLDSIENMLFDVVPGARNAFKGDIFEISAFTETTAAIHSMLRIRIRTSFSSSFVLHQSMEMPREFERQVYAEADKRLYMELLKYMTLGQVVGIHENMNTVASIINVMKKLLNGTNVSFDIRRGYTKGIDVYKPMQDYVFGCDPYKDETEEFKIDW